MPARLAPGALGAARLRLRRIGRVEILDAQGRTLEEVTIRLTPDEVADLMVGASSIDDGLRHVARYSLWMSSAQSLRW